MGKIYSYLCLYEIKDVRDEMKWIIGEVSVVCAYTGVYNVSHCDEWVYHVLIVYRT